MLALYCIILENHGKKRGSVDEQRLDSPWRWFANRLQKVLVNFK